VLPLLLNEAPVPPRATPYTAATEAARANMTFEEWFTDYRADPANSGSISHLYTDRQYFLLLKAVSTGIRVAEMPCSGEEKRWLYHKMGSHTYRSVMMSYGGPQQLKQVGQALIWQQGKPLNPTAPIVIEAIRRVVPLSQIVACIQFCHADSTGHRGQDATLHKVHQLFEGVSRPLVREAVKRCPVCQTKAAKQYKARLQPIVSNHLFDRLLIDLIDKRTQADSGYHYIMHVADHNSRFHFIRPLRSKHASAVAEELAQIFAIIGGCRILQSDQGPEFKGEVSAVCDEFGVEQVRSSPYTPSTNGLVEKYNHVVKVAIAAYQAENNTRSWVACLPRVALQMNTTWSQSIRCTPYELVFGHAHSLHCVPVLPSTQLNYLDSQDWVPDPEDPDAPLQPPASLALFAVAASPSPPPSPPSPRSAHSPSTASAPLLADEEVRDCPFGVAGELGRLCSAKLNVGGLHFRRWGCIGRGRCAICAVELALRDCYWVETEADMEVFCDERRIAYRNRLEVGCTNVERKQWLQQMVNVGGGDSAVGKQTPSQVRHETERTMLRDLSNVGCNLGWEFLVLAAAYHNVNILLFPVVITGETIEAIDQVLLPHQWNEQLPVIAIYHRAFYMARSDGEGPVGSVDSGGHYETVFCHDELTNRRLSMFQPGHPTWNHLRRLAGEVLARSASGAARARMEAYYNLNVQVVDFAVGHAVGVRTNQTKQRTKKRGTINIPGLIVAIKDNVRVGGATAGQRVYTCLTKYGVIDRQLKVDGLVYLSANNHAALFDLLRQHLTDNTWHLLERVTMESAVEAFLSERDPAATVAPPRQQPPRAVNVGGPGDEWKEEDDGEGDVEAEEEHGGVGEQRPVSTAAVASQAQHFPVRILRRSGPRYQVEWNDPPGERTWVTVSNWDNRAEYRELVQAFREEERARAEANA
jgi:hypothetical protein